MSSIKKFDEFNNTLQPLLEKTFNIDADVDYIYEKSRFPEFLKNFNEGKEPYKYQLFSLEFNFLDIIFNKIPSSELKTEECIKAHSIIPLDIITGISRKGSHYNPTKPSISISINPHALSVYYTDDEKNLPDVEKKMLKREITEQRLKIGIHHELSHWISDCFYGKHITNIVSSALELQNPERMLLKQKDVNMTYFEIDAQVHSIKELKRNFSQEQWDMLTIEDIFKEYPSIMTVYRVLRKEHGLDVALIWQKNLIKRLQREGLLGKNMKTFLRKDF